MGSCEAGCNYIDGEACVSCGREPPPRSSRLMPDLDPVDWDDNSQEDDFDPYEGG